MEDGFTEIKPESKQMFCHILWTIIIYIISDEFSGKAAGHELKGAQALHHHARSCSDFFPNVELLFPLVALVGMNIFLYS